MSIADRRTRGSYLRMIFQHSFDGVCEDGPDENGSVRGANRDVLTVRTEGSSCAVEADFEAVRAGK